MSKKVWIGVVAVVVVLGVAFLGFRAVNSDSTPSATEVSDIDSTLPDPNVTSGPTSGDQKGSTDGQTGSGATDATGGGDGGTATPKPQTTARSFEDLQVDENQVDPALVESAVCGLNSEYFANFSGPGQSYDKRIEAIRLGLTTLDENLAAWFLAASLDGRIDQGVELGKKAVAQWGKAVALADLRKTAASKVALAKGDAIVKKIDALQASVLCP